MKTLAAISVAVGIALGGCGDSSTPAEKRALKPPTTSAGEKPRPASVVYKCSSCQKTQTPVDSAGLGPSC